MTRKLVTSSDAIEFRHLRYFIAAAEHGSFRKAGNSLGLSQSAISRCIADLEDRMGASLFHRHSWGVSQTFAGHDLPLNFHPAATGARLVFTPIGAG
ncbi:helix-turn-helix domain-containing protein [Paracoccus pantotrophus]|nr:LysR family transcriptional regulator [Paracoccus pantotrophus]